MYRKFLLLLIIIPLIVFVSKIFVDQHSSRVAGANTSKNLLSPLPTEIKENLLKKAVDAELIGTKGFYSIVILNLKTNEKYFSHEHRLYKAASLYKLWVMATAYEQIESGKLKESDILSRDIGELYARFDVATPSAQTQPEPTPADSTSTEGKEGEEKKNIITYSIEEALEKMIIISDNTAALMLSEKVRLSNVALFLKKYDFTESKINTAIGYPVTTPNDMALFMKKLYKGELANKENTNKMLALLKRQRLNGKIPKYLPDGTIIAHKTGELEEVTHDVGIVYTPDGDYIISILSESTSRVQAEERIANVSEAVYKYFTIK
jgi:beta-lactamase class A